MTIYANAEMPEEYIANIVNRQGATLHSAAGTSVAIPSVAVTADTGWEITSISFFYTATETAGNRLPALSITFPGTLYPIYEWTCPYNVPASAKFSCSGGAGGPTFIPYDQASITLSPADPTASSLTYTLSTLYAHRVQTLRFVYTTDATAGNRLVEVQFQDPSSNVVGESFISTQAASLAYVYAFALGVPANAQNASLHQTGPLPAIDMQPGSKIKIQDANGIATGDRVTSVRIASLTTPSVLVSQAVGFAPLPLPTPFQVPAGTIITIYDANNIDNGSGGDTVALYIDGVKGY